MPRHRDSSGNGESLTPRSLKKVLAGSFKSPKQRKKQAAAIGKPSPSSPRRKLKLVSPLVLLRRRFASSLPEKPVNTVDWLAAVCPQDVVPLVLAYAGPQTVSALSRTNRYWRAVMEEEETWRVLCEELGKWRAEDKRQPPSWKEYYRMNPIIPVDFSSIHNALTTICGDKQKKKSNFQVSGGIRILMKPGEYEVRKPICIHTSRSSMRISIERMELPNTPRPKPRSVPRTKPEQHLDSRRLRELLASLGEGNDADVEDDANDGDEDDDYDQEVVLTYHSRKANKSLFRVEQGDLFLQDIQIRHHCFGVDIWSGNAAIHVEPSESSLAEVSLNRCDITSASGRGIVVLRGGQLSLKECNIHHCAATGIYVSGASTSAQLIKTDIMENGSGGRGLARGHSGVCIEHGEVDIIDSNISKNSASGISVIAQDNCRLALSDSDVVANGLIPVDLPNGAADNAMSLTILTSARDGNRLASDGAIRPRSALLKSSVIVNNEEEFEELVSV